MRYTVTGRRGDDVAVLTWSDEAETDGVLGYVLGPDVAAADALWLLAFDAEGEMVGPGAGPYTTTNHLASPLSAFMLMHALFDGVLDVVGDVPVIPPVPKGAVA